jgi:hypothetical protein
LIISTGIVDPSPNSGADTNGYLGIPSIEQGKALLALLDETAKKGEEALKALVTEIEDGGKGNEKLAQNRSDGSGRISSGSFISAS